MTFPFFMARYCFSHIPPPSFSLAQMYALHIACTTRIRKIEVDYRPVFHDNKYGLPFDPLRYTLFLFGRISLLIVFIRFVAFLFQRGWAEWNVATTSFIAFVGRWNPIFFFFIPRAPPSFDFQLSRLFRFDWTAVCTLRSTSSKRKRERRLWSKKGGGET